MTKFLILTLVALCLLGCGCSQWPEQLKNVSEDCRSAGFGVGFDKAMNGEICRAYCVEAVAQPMPTVDITRPVKDHTVRAVVCYNPDGTGPMTTCPAVIECHNEPNTNSEVSRIPCPRWGDDPNIRQ